MQVYGPDTTVRAIPITRSPIKLACSTSQPLTKVNFQVLSLNSV